MKEELTRDQLRDRCNELENKFAQALETIHLQKRQLTALMGGARAVLEEKGFTESARAIFNYCRILIGATSGYVALLRENDMENEVLFLEPGGLPCDADPDLPMPIRGLRAEAYTHNKAVYHNAFMNSEWAALLPKGHVVLKNVLFAPLIIGGKTVGIMGLANKSSDFNDNDARMAAGFGELAAIALENSRQIDQREAIEMDQHRLIGELNSALSQVKKLSGMLPICAWCKKIRDDEGYWTQLEKYIHEHSEAVFSHSICPTCMEERYLPSKK